MILGEDALEDPQEPPKNTQESPQLAIEPGQPINSSGRVATTARNWKAPDGRFRNWKAPRLEGSAIGAPATFPWRKMVGKKR